MSVNSLIEKILVEMAQAGKVSEEMSLKAERIKYLATFVNTCAASSFTVGVIAPLAAAFYGVQGRAATSFLAIGTIIWLFAALFLHLSTQRILGALSDD